MKKTIIANSFIALALVLAVGVMSSAEAAVYKGASEPKPKAPASVKEYNKVVTAKGQVAKKLIVGKVTSMTDTSLHVKMGDKDYTVNVDSPTKVVDRMGKTMKLGDIKVDDKVSISGTVTGLIVQAKIVRDVSTPMPVQAQKTGIKGKKPQRPKFPSHKASAR